MEGRRSIYIGETGRSAWERGAEHMRAWREKEEGSFLWKHEANQHGEGNLLEEEVKMKVISKPRKALQRQVEEAVRIEGVMGGELMNSKKGYGTNKIPRITIVMGEDLRGRRSEWERERVKRLEREEREREAKRVLEHERWEEGRECIWEIQEEREAWERWRGEKMGAARTRGRLKGDGGDRIDGGGDCVVWGRVILAPHKQGGKE